MMIGLLRHGETAWNREKRIQGQIDISLNETGIRQAEAVAQRMRQVPWDAIVTSDLARARETAEVIARESRIPLFLTDARLRERCYGELEGTTLEERVDRWGENWRDLDHCIESDEDVRKRGVAAITEAVSGTPADRILFVSHGGLIRQVLAEFIPEREIGEIRNTSLTLLELIEHRWECKTFNCVAHL